METFGKIKENYRFTAADEKNLQSLQPVAEKYKNDFAKEFYFYIENFEEAAKVLSSDKVVTRHQEALKKWILQLFDGEYGARYFRELEMIGMAHVRIGLKAHYVNAAMHFVRQYLIKVLEKEFQDKDELAYLMLSVDKIIDINLDVMTSSYLEEEKKQFFISMKVESFLIQLANRFTFGLNLVLVMGLMILGAMAIIMVFSDISHIFDGKLEKGLLSTLGSLLMLWVVIELMDTEIKHLRGGHFAIKVFVSVALVAMIRKILITSLKTDAIEVQVSQVGAVAVLGVIYWLIAKADSDREKGHGS